MSHPRKRPAFAPVMLVVISFLANVAGAMALARPAAAQLFGCVGLLSAVLGIVELRTRS